MTERRTWLIGGIVLAAALAAVALVTTLLAPTLPTRSYSQFLDAAAAGEVRSVTQQGATIEVEGSDGRYLVQAPTILTDVFRDLEAAAGDEVPPFQTIPATDAGEWLTLWPVFAANLALVVAFIALAVALQRRRPGQPT